ncbi:MAG: hypothetical protein ACJAVI_005606 [Candidatus Azotimanducaceae bacterium]|jgi:hypothetical protein
MSVKEVAASEDMRALSSTYMRFFQTLLEKSL